MVSRGPLSLTGVTPVGRCVTGAFKRHSWWHGAQHRTGASEQIPEEGRPVHLADLGAFSVKDRADDSWALREAV